MVTHMRTQFRKRCTPALAALASGAGVALGAVALPLMAYISVPGEVIKLVQGP